VIPTAPTNREIAPNPVPAKVRILRILSIVTNT
jgi:hypothetical protein